MAFLGDFGKIFQAAVSPIVLPTKFAISTITKGPAPAVAEARRELSLYTSSAKAALAVVGVGGNSKQIDEPQQTPGQEQYIQPYQQSYFQPTQFSGGSYDPNIGGGYPSWDFSTSWDWGTYQEQQTPSWITSEWGTWD